MKGQVQAVSAVLITGIVIGTIAAVYVWGTPLLEKREGQAELNQIEGDVVGLANSIESVSDGGEGVGSDANIRVSDGEVFVNEEQNYVEIITYSDNPMYPMEAWTIIEGSNLQGLSIGAGDYGIKGQDSEGVVAVTTTDGGNENRVTYRVEFRNVLDEDSEQLELTDISVAGSERSTGQTTVSASNQGNENDEFEIGTGEELPIEKTNVRLTLS